MRHVQIPDDLVLGAAAHPATYLLAYTTSRRSERTKITLRYHLFSFLLAGEKTVVHPTGTVRIRPSQFLLLPAGNCLMSEKLAEPDADYRSTMLLFSDEALAAFFRKYPDLPLQPPAAGSPAVHVFAADAFLTAFVQSLTLLVGAPAEVRPDLQLLKLEELLLYLSQQYPEALYHLRAQVLETAESQKIREVLASELPPNITVEELAFLCHTSLSTFKRRFGRLYGMPPSKWLLRQRLAVAEQLLRQGTLKASEIYDRVGYESMSSFVQSFKQAYGITPKKFQLQHAA